MSRYDLADFEWRVIEPLLPNKRRGVPRVDDLRVLNGIFGCCDRARRDFAGHVASTRRRGPERPPTGAFAPSRLAIFASTRR